jgi:probable O-glycosylation ligase (exosortase A-associated)
MKQLIFMIAATLLGTAGVFLYDPFLGVAVYDFFAVLRPQYMWEWSLPKEVAWSYYVGLATIAAAVLRPTGARFTWAHWSVLLFGCWIGITYVTAHDHEVAYPWFMEYLKHFLMFAVSALLVHKLQQVWILMVIAAGTLGYIAYEVNYHYFIDHYLGIFRNGYGGLDNNGAGLMLAMGVPLCYFTWEGMRSRWRWLFLGFIPVLVHAVLMTYSRGAMVSLIAVVPLFFLRSRRRAWLMAFAVGMAFIVPVLAGKEIRERFFSIEQNDVDESAQGRRRSWAAAWAIAQDNPIFGVGVRNANLFSYQYGADMLGRTIHSQYLQIAADNGLTGLALYLTALGSVWWGLRQARLRAARGVDAESKQVYSVCCGVEAAMLVFCVGGAFLSLEVFELPYLLLFLGAQVHGLMRQRVQQEIAAEQQPIFAGSHIRVAGGSGEPLVRPA